MGVGGGGVMGSVMGVGSVMGSVMGVGNAVSTAAHSFIPRVVSSFKSQPR
jgi:hypothetical protein